MLQAIIGSTGSVGARIGVSRQGGEQTAIPATAERKGIMGVPISGYGMYLNDDELDGLVDRLSHDEQVEEDYGHVDGAMDLYDMCDVQLLNHDNMWDGWRVRFLGDDHDTFGDDGTEPTGAFLFAMKQGDIVAGSDQLYSSVSELADEMRKWYGKYLPDGFDYAKHLALLRAYLMY